MATLITKNSSTASAVPAVGDLVKGELAVNVTDKKVYTKDNSAAVVKLVGSLGNQEANAVAVTGGTINGTTIGATTPSTGAFTTASASSGFTGNLTGNVTGNVSGTASNVTGVVAIANGGTGLSSLGTGVQSALGQAVTGSGSFVLSTSPSLTTPNLGTPSAAVLTNATGLPLTTGVTGTLGVANGGTGITAFGTGVATALGQNVTGSGGIVLATSPSLTTPNLGTPSAATLTNATGLPISTGVSGLGTGVATALGVATGSAGAFVVNGGALGTPSSGTLTNATGLPVSTGVSGLGTGVATALAVNTGSAGAFVVNGGALGTPSSGTVTNLTGTASININGTVGATTPTTGAFTTLSASGNITVSGGTANGVAYLNGSKVLTTGSALTFDGTSLSVAIVKRDVDNSFVTLLGGTSSATSAAVYATGPSYAAASTIYIDSAETVFRSLNGVSSRMALTSTGLGIGTSSPATKLHISGSTTPNLRFEQTNSSVVHQFQAASGNFFLNIDATNAIGGSTFLIQQAGSTVATLSSTGNLGLGVTPSAWATFKAMQIGNGTADTFIAVSGNQGDFGVNAYYNAGWKYQTSSVASSRYEQSSGVHQWFTAPSGTAGNAISFTQAMTLDASGNLLVGGTTNTSMATVQISVGSTSTASSALQFLSTTSGSNGIYFGDGTSSTDRYRGYLEYNHSSDFMVLATAATERARITSGGFFKASNSGTYAGSTASYHELYSNASGDWIGYFTQATATNPNGVVIQYTAAAPNGTGNTFLYCQDNAAVRATIRSNGGIANYSGNDVNLSDRREKTNFAPAKSYLDTICAIPVQTFNYIDQSEDDPGLTLGVVAQDVQAVAPELVMESNWGTAEDPKMRLSIYQTDLQYALMKCIQEQQAIITDLRARVAQLEAK